MPERPAQEIPNHKESAQYITYSAKELMYMLNDKVDRIDEKVDAMAVKFASLPAHYVTQESIKEARRESVVAKRFAIASTIASVGALGTFFGLLFGA